MNRESEKGTHSISKNRVAGTVRVLVTCFMCGIFEMTIDTQFDESILIRVPEEWGAKYPVLGNSCTRPESKNTVKETKRKFEEEQ